MDAKVKEALEAVAKLNAKGKETVGLFLGNPPDLQDAILKGLNGKTLNRQKARAATSKAKTAVAKVKRTPDKKKANAKKANAKKANAKKANAKKANGKKNGNGLDPEVSKCKGKELVYQQAKRKANPKGETSRQAVQLSLKKAEREEAEQPLFGKIVDELKAEGKLKTNGHGWVIS